MAEFAKFSGTHIAPCVCRPKKQFYIYIYITDDSPQNITMVFYS